MTLMRKMSVCEASGEVDDVPVSYLAAYQKGVVLLDRAGISNAANEAMWLVEAGLGISRLAVYADHKTPVPIEAWTDMLKGFRRRAAQEPLQYILGTQEFRGLSLNVAEGVFIPRPETELLVDEVIAHTELRDSGLMADIGTGSGCIAIALAAEMPAARVYAIDRSPTAIAMAQQNAVRHRVQDRITFLEGNLVEPLRSQGLVDCFSCIVSNPPYIPSGQIPSLPTTVRDFEPAMALDGGIEGLDFYFLLLQDTPGLLKLGGRLVMEMGDGQAARVCHEAERQGHFKVCRIRDDNAGIARVVCLEKIKNKL